MPCRSEVCHGVDGLLKSIVSFMVVCYNDAYERIFA